MQSIHYPIPSGKAMQDFARQLADSLLTGSVIQSTAPFIIHLIGNLGAGKTTFCQGLISGLGYQGSVKSPTYSLVESYPVNAPFISQVHHFDFYRISNPQELEYFGIRDYFTHGALCLIEWPNRAGNLAGNPDLIINIMLDPQNPEQRQVNLQPQHAETLLWLKQWIL